MLRIQAPPTNQDCSFIRRTVALADQACRLGHRPFAALIVIGGEVRYEAMDQVLALQDPTAHAEIAAIRAFARENSAFELLGATLYTNVEPCPMCAGAIYYAGIKRLVYSVSRVQFDALIAAQRRRAAKLYQSCRTLLNDGGLTQVIGPILEEDGLEVLLAYPFVEMERLAG